MYLARSLSLFSSLVTVLVLLNPSHKSVVQCKYAGNIPPDKFDRFSAGFRPPSVPLVVVDPYLRSSLSCS